MGIDFNLSVVYDFKNQRRITKLEETEKQRKQFEMSGKEVIASDSQFSAGDPKTSVSR